MPIWFELIVLLLATYAAGFGIGAFIWGRSVQSPTQPAEHIDEEDTVL